jgi:hypothetical protein
MPLVPVCSQNSSVVRWSLDPLPAEPKVCLPGIRLQVIDDVGDRLVRRVRRHDQHVGRLHGDGDRSKSFSASYGMLFIRCGTMTSGPSEVTSSV